MEEIAFRETFKLLSPVYIDLRTRSEYESGTIPGAVNLPLFDEEERQEIGRIYTEESRERALMYGFELVSERLPALLKFIRKLTGNGQVVLFCWRGGLRSRSVQKVAVLLEIPVYLLKGGYRAFRKYVLDFLEAYELPGPLVTIHGKTGAGKSNIVKELEKKGLPVVDLEALAGHRGSVFGEIGFSRSHGQKHFDAWLWKRLQELYKAPYIIIEGESKRLGNIYLPSFFWDDVRKQGINILIETSLEKRVKNILLEYGGQLKNPNIADDASQALAKIAKRIVGRIGNHGYRSLEEVLKKGQYSKFVEMMLRYYYDPLYEVSIKKFAAFHLEVQGINVEKAAREIKDFLQEELPQN